MKIKLQGISLPKMLSDLTYKYHVLVILSLGSLIVAALSMIAAIALSVKAPTVMAFSQSAEILEKHELPKAEDEIKLAITRYINFRYKWDAKSVSENIKKAESFIESKSLTAFQNNMASVVKFSLDRDVLQRIYPTDMKVDLKSQIVFITGDRVTSIQGLKAAGNLNLALEFESGPRTQNNPWGIYITKEKEGQ
jgi:hypothetical protein